MLAQDISKLPSTKHQNSLFSYNLDPYEGMLGLSARIRNMVLAREHELPVTIKLLLGQAETGVSITLEKTSIVWTMLSVLKAINPEVGASFSYDKLRLLFALSGAKVSVPQTKEEISQECFRKVGGKAKTLNFDYMEDLIRQGFVEQVEPGLTDPSEPRFVPTILARRLLAAPIADHQNSSLSKFFGGAHEKLT